MKKRYEAAEKLLTKNIRGTVLNGHPAVCWISETEFSYDRQIRTESGIETVTVYVDAQDGAEKKIEKKDAVEQQVQIEQETGRRVDVVENNEMTMSPDGHVGLINRNHNLVMVEMETGRETALTEDGEEWCEYGCYIDIYSQITQKKAGYVEHPLVLWSPDGKHFVTYKADRRNCRKLYLTESFVDSLAEMRPRQWEYPCPFVMDSDDEIPHYSLYVGDVETATLTKVEAPDFLYPIYTAPDKSWVRWLDDGSAFYFTWLARGYQESRLYLANPKTGKTELLIREKTDTFLNHGAFGLLDGFGTYCFSNYVTKDKKQAFWQSEKNGYAHLYRYELETGTPDGAGEDLFGEEWNELIVQKLVRVDEEARRIYFMGNNVAECSDPLYYQLFSVNFDDGDVCCLTPEDATHSISMGENSFVDTYSRVDLPPVTVLRALDGMMIRKLEEADITDLMKQGYQIPQRFTVTAADGVTKLHGILVPPAMMENADGSETYPLIDYIYGAAQLYNVPREFTWDNSMNREVMGGLQEFAQLGFAGIILDGRGTPGRGKAFHDLSFRNFEFCDGLIDHVHCAKELKEKFPFLDMDRVGMWGNSGGGYATVNAMFRYPEFYKVGVASSGNYDQRMYEHSWTARYGGLYEADTYARADVTQYAGNLRGKLMLAYGAMDDNVTMSQTIRLCDELNRRNKDYDLMVLPRVNHNVPSDLYFIRRKLDYFVEHLLGERPPKEYRFSCMEDVEQQ